MSVGAAPVHPYEFAVLGAPSADERASLIAIIEARVCESGLACGHDVLVRDAGGGAARARRGHARRERRGHGRTRPAGGGRRDILRRRAGQGRRRCRGHPDRQRADHPHDRTLGRDIPTSLQRANGLRRRDGDKGMEELVSAFLERVGAEMRPEADILPIASTGGATLEVAERCGPIADYTDDLDYVSLMHRSLGIEGRERRYRTPQELPSYLAGRLGAPDDPDPPSGFGR